MAVHFEKPRDVIGGGLIMAIGAGFLLLGSDLEFGTSHRMGPGYFPTVLNVILIVLGAVMVVQALRKPREEGAFSHLPWRGLLLILGATLFFGFTLRGLGLVPVLLVVVFATAWASRYARLRTSVPLAAGMTLFCFLIFIRGLGLPLPLFGPWVSPSYWVPAEPAPSPAETSPPAETAPAPNAPAAQ